MVKLVHGDVDAGQYKAPDDFHRGIDGGLKNLHVGLVIAAEHPVYLSAARIVVANAHAQTGIVLPDELLDVSQSVVPPVAATALEAELAQGQGHIVRNHEQAPLINVFLVEPIAHGVAAEVHERGGLEQDDFAALQAGFGHEAVSPVLKNDIGRLGKSVQYHESGVVAGSRVFSARIAQSTYQVFVH